MKRTISKTSVILYDFSQDIREKYHIGHLMEGTVRSQIAQFHCCHHRDLNMKRVVKTYYISDAQLTTAGLFFRSHPIQDFDLILNEIRALSELNHPSILRLYEVYMTEKYIHLVLEYLKGGEVYDSLTFDRFGLNESVAVLIQLLEAVKYMHEKGYAHRALCVENLMFVGNDKKRVKIIGFSGAAKTTFGFRQRFGSPMYMAPEVFNQDYDEKCDVWALGVIFFTMVCGHQPFQSNNFNDLMKKITKVNYISSANYKNLDKEVKKFIKKILVVKNRPSADKILKFPLILKYLSENNKKVIKRLIKSVKSIRNDYGFSLKVRLGNKLKIAVYKILSPLNLLHDITSLEALWVELDSNGLDVIMESDLVHNIETLLSKSELSEKAFNMLKKFDLDSRGCVSKDEFIGLLVEISDKSLIRQAFNSLDQDSDGLIDSSDFDSYFKTADYEGLKKLFQESLEKSKVDFETFFVLVTKFVVSF
jgi:calcium-dependent protein kinase